MYDRAHFIHNQWNRWQLDAELFLVVANAAIKNHCIYHYRYYYYYPGRRGRLIATPPSAETANQCITFTLSLTSIITSIRGNKTNVILLTKCWKKYFHCESRVETVTDTVAKWVNIISITGNQPTCRWRSLARVKWAGMWSGLTLSASLYQNSAWSKSDILKYASPVTQQHHHCDEVSRSGTHRCLRNTSLNSSNLYTPSP